MGSSTFSITYLWQIIFVLDFCHIAPLKPPSTQRTRLSIAPCRKAWGLWVSRISARDWRADTSRPSNACGAARSASS